MNFHAHAVGAIGAAIVHGRFEPGAVLPLEAGLIAELGISRTVLREALKTLAAKGMVEARAGVGTRVLARKSWNMFDADVLRWHADTSVDIALLASLSEMRLAIEPACAAMAAERRTDAEASAILALADEMARSGQSDAGFAATDLALHCAIAAASQNPFMLSIGNLVEAALIRSFTLSSPVKDQPLLAESIAAHRRIAQAVHDRDAREAEAAMRLTIFQGIERVRDRHG